MDHGSLKHRRQLRTELHQRRRPLHHPQLPHNNNNRQLREIGEKTKKMKKKHLKNFS
jgi:hypothetical protein